MNMHETIQHLKERKLFEGITREQLMEVFNDTSITMPEEYGGEKLLEETDWKVAANAIFEFNLYLVAKQIGDILTALNYDYIGEVVAGLLV